ncbi:hypothetical protein AX13_15220 [Comamonas aquatica DA1877]|uniref:Uncharacterized protein n=1 Tax=Comamonas aquatica DA1877 TaxID=1457173 RepID=A0A014MR44_9BURK|nr:hypothetical protein AX13_15220 [Comamonas aquatica DA1877]
MRSKIGSLEIQEKWFHILHQKFKITWMERHAHFSKYLSTSLRRKLSTRRLIGFPESLRKVILRCTMYIAS